jgi:hypothetical protein
MVFVVEPNMPTFPAANFRRKFYGETKEDEICLLMQKIQLQEMECAP